MAADIILPKMGLTMDEATIVTWLKQVGDTVNEEEPIVEVQTDKSILEVEAPHTGVLTEILYEEGELVQVGEILGSIGVSEVSSKEGNGQKESMSIQPTEVEKVKKPSPQKATAVHTNQSDRIRISPAARRLLKENDLLAHELVGSGPLGRIVLTDVYKALDARKTNITKSRETVEQVGNDTQKEPVSGIRQVIATRMTDSFMNVPQFQLNRDMNVTNMETLRKKVNELGNKGVKLSINDFLIKAVALAIAKQPIFNSSYEYSEKQHAIIKKKDINVGLAVAVNDSLLVPVICNADQLSVIEIAKERDRLVNKAKAGKLTVDEMSNGSFTISNLGAFGIDDFTALVNPPESGILAVGSSKLKPVVNEQGEIEVKPILRLSASFDHRLIDGAVGAVFLQNLIEQLESKEWELF
ncbi:dihydrolipoamide acetyltransferase family protein [Sporosarcina sp. FSL W7-1349]|uniref:dihydrolipoamide acetyltransferase family protein n=1 Tax=Sporosarcina sp. FSL W7-1349 TaxID=2921561 RepID=UPI0030FB4E0F